MAKVTPSPPRTSGIDPAEVARVRAGTMPRTEACQFGPPVMPSGVVPKTEKLAMDRIAMDSYEYLNSGGYPGAVPFLGFAALAQLSQRPEYRMMTETLAKEMTRKWISIKSIGESNHEKVKKIEAHMRHHKVKSKFKRALEHDGFYGRGQIYIDVGAGNPSEPLLRTPKTLGKGMLRGFRNLEPIWSYPGAYEATNPLSKNFYVPESWYVMAKTIDASRMLTIIGREVSDILKPAYAFAGLSITQLAQEYVNNFLRTRNSVSDLLHSFSLTILKTNMENILTGAKGGAQQMQLRADLFNDLRDNRGLMAIDKEAEEIDQINTPLTTVDALMAQSQEQMASVAHIPLVKLLGVTPSGLNASSDGEMRAFYDWIAASQEDTLSDPLRVVLDVIQLDLFGEIDPDISFEFEPLWEMDDEAQARIRGTTATADQTYVDIGAISPEEVRAKLAADPLSGYAGIDPDELPDPPEEPTGDKNDRATDPAKRWAGGEVSHGAV